MSHPVDSDAADKLDRALKRFGVLRIPDITELYDFYPNYQRSKLDSGQYGEVFRMKSRKNPDEPIRIVKKIRKARVTQNILQVHHACAEIAVTTLLHNEFCNHAVGVFHSRDHLFIVLELCEGTQTDPRTRLYYLFARHRQYRLADVEHIVSEWESRAPSDPRKHDEYYDALVRAFAVENEWKEPPLGADLFNYIVFHKRVPDLKAAIILSHALKACEFLHSCLIVHRDIKTENFIVGETRRAVPISNPETGDVVGVRIYETLHCKLIDFNLVKYLKLTQWPQSPSPNAFASTSDPLLGEVPGNALSCDDPPRVVQVTPCGTEIYCAMEAISGIISSGLGQSKWISDIDTLPKLDVYGCGTMMFCMANGRPPFRLPPMQRFQTRDATLRGFQSMISAGPVFSHSVSDAAKRIILKLMENDPKKRPTATDALQDEFFQRAGDTFAYDVFTNGRIRFVRDLDSSPLENLAQEFPALSTTEPPVQQETEPPQPPCPVPPVPETPPPPRPPTPNSTDVVVAQQSSSVDQESTDSSRGELDDVMAAMRGKEDGGDYAGKE